MTTTNETNGNHIELGTRNILRERAELIPLALLPPEELQNTLRALVDAAGNDDHICLNPTHVMIRAGKVCGYLSLNGLPQVHCWFDTHSGHALDSIKMIEHGTVAMREHGMKDFAVACAENSPFHPHMERLGFKKVGTTTIWRKV